MSQIGYLIVAEILGYTAFLTQTELEHAQSIIDDLLNTLIDNIKPPLVFSKLERKEVFIYVPEGSFVQGQSLLESIEKLYCLFVLTQETMQRNTLCNCQACKLIPDLDLKFVVHYGTFSLTDVQAQQELFGADVMVIRQLSKTPFGESTGIKGYAFITTSCAEAMGIDELTKSMKAYSETYEHIGEVNGFVHDIRPICTRELEQRLVTVNPEDAWFVVDTDLPVSPALAWDYITEPEYRRLWLKAAKITVNGRKKGRVGIGTRHICAHGRYQIDQIIIEWRPFEYLTVDSFLPMKGMQRLTTRLTPCERGTRVSWFFDWVVGQNRIHTILLRLLFSPMKWFMMNQLKQGSIIIRDKIEAELTQKGK